jgi:PERQ amino acid-rich with GYF domain-containing protein
MWSRFIVTFSSSNTADDRSRRANGATQTFRRPSHATTPSGSISQPAARDASGTPIPSANTGVYVPPHAQRNGGSVEGRYQYSRDQLLQLQQAEQGSGAIRDGLSKLFVNSWEPNLPNGSSSASWGRKDDHSRDAQSGVDLCWDRDGSVVPLSLSEMTEDEREV